MFLRGPAGQLGCLQGTVPRRPGWRTPAEGYGHVWVKMEGDVLRSPLRSISSHARSSPFRLIGCQTLASLPVAVVSVDDSLYSVSDMVNAEWDPVGWGGVGLCNLPAM